MCAMERWFDPKERGGGEETQGMTAYNPSLPCPRKPCRRLSYRIVGPGDVVKDPCERG